MKKISSKLIIPQQLQASPELITVQALMPIDSSDRERLKNDIKESKEIRDPIKVYYDNKQNSFLILGGFNRWQIAIELGLDTVPID
jgi:ParB-like chromosome segregation protein Spo0J